MIYIAALILALLVHEMGHIIAIYITHAGYVTGVHIGVYGCGIVWEWGGSFKKALVVTIAGSAMNLFLFWLPHPFGIIMVLFGLLNLLMPFKYADGYRAWQTWKRIGGINNERNTN